MVRAISQSVILGGFRQLIASGRSAYKDSKGRIMKNWALVVGVLLGVVGCGSVDSPVGGNAGEAGELEQAGAAGAVHVDRAGAAGAVHVEQAGAPAVAEAGSAGELEQGGETSTSAGAGGAPVAGSGGTAGADVGGANSAGSAGAYVAGAGGASSGGTAGADTVGGASSGGTAGESAGAGGSPAAGSSAGGATGSAGSGSAGAPGVPCPSHTSLESISPQGHELTFTFPAFVNVLAADLSPLAGYNVTPFIDGVQSAKAFAGGSMWVIPPINRMKALAFRITPNTTTPVMPDGGLVLFCK